jgi:TolB-like protein
VKVFEELRQRKVLQTAAVYFAVAWGATEILSYLIERIPVFPAWTETAIAVLFVLGFPVTVFLAWVFDVREGGVRRADPASGLGKGVIFLSLTGLVVATAGLSYLIWPRVQAQQGIVAVADLGTVAVLPLENLTGDPSLGYLGAGLAEDIRQRLLAQTDLKVIGRMSMAGFTGAGADLASIRGMLDAGHVLEGNLQNVAGQLQVSVALLDTATGKQVWGNTFRANRADFDPLRQRIVTSLTEQLALTVRVRKAEAPVPSDALEAYLHGLAELDQPDVADGWFDEAVRLAPDFADAWARRALLRVDMIWRGLSVTQAWDEAEPMFERAHQIEPGNLIADFAEANLLWMARLDPPASFEVLKRAELRAPNHPLVLGGFTSALGYLPEHKQEAVLYGRRYVAQDPLSAEAHNSLGLALMFTGRLDEALQENARALELDPNFMRAWDYRANWQFFYNRQADALVTYTQKARIENPASDETNRCMILMAGSILPADRAVPLFENAIERGIGMAGAHWWCDNPLEALQWKLKRSGRTAEAESVQARLDNWYANTGNIPTNADQVRPANPEKTVVCSDDLCRLRQELGDDAVEAWLGPAPPIHHLSYDLTARIVRVFKKTGHEEQSRRLAALAVQKIRKAAVSKAGPSETGNLVTFLTFAGDLTAAMDYAEQVGPEAFYLFGIWLGDDLPELQAELRLAAFRARAQAMLQQEVKKFDRLVASGEIVMPFAVPEAQAITGSE